MTARKGLVGGMRAAMVRRCVWAALSLAVPVALCLPGAAFAAKEKKADTWRIRENLVQRLEAEVYKINVLTRELAHIRNMLNDVRDMEVYPTEVTRLTDDSLVSVDKKIEQLEKQHRALVELVEAMRQPVADAMAILREMVMGDPVEEMFLVIEQGDLERVEQMLTIKRRVTAFWTEIDRLLADVVGKMGVNIRGRVSEVSAEDEFLSIIKANLGLQYEDYHNRINAIKDSLAARSTALQAQQILKIELASVQQYINRGELFLARRMLSAMAARYDATYKTGDVYALLAQVELLSANPVQVLEAVAKIPDEPEYETARTLYRFQALYMMKDYEGLWNAGRSAKLERLSPERRNMGIWLVMEAGIGLGAYDGVPAVSQAVVKDGPDALKVMHALGRSYAAKKDFANALSVFENVLKMRQAQAADQAVLNRIRLTMAQCYHETGRYDEALAIYFVLLNDERMFEEVLFGLVWCYIGKGQYAKAETSLRKLINQAPGSPLAVEGILTLAKRFISKADYEWNKLRYLTRVEARLEKTRLSLEKKAAGAADGGGRYKKALSEVNDMLAKTRGESRFDYRGIADLYDQGMKVCGFIPRYYATGTFQESSLSSQREQLMHRLDSLLAAVTAPATAAARTKQYDVTRKDILKIKGGVGRSRTLRAEMLLGRYRWEREYLDWMKSLALARVNDIAAATAGTDSAGMAAVRTAKVAADKSLDSLVVAGDELDRKWHDRLTKECRDVISAGVDSTDRMYFTYHLGELAYYRENEEYSRKYYEFEQQRERYDSLMVLFREGKIVDMPDEPKPPALDHDGSMRHFYTALGGCAQCEYVPAIRYSLAWCYSDLNRHDRAIAEMETLATAWPEHPYAPQALMYIGEYLFDNGRLADAVKAYQRVMQYPESKWFDEALYKLAWTQYRLSNPEKAISSFLALVDLGNTAGAAGRAFLESESMDYIAISFSESDMTGEKGLYRATKFVERFGDEMRGTQILHRLARVYREQGRYDMARRTYQTLLGMFPKNRNTPSIERELIALYDRDSSAVAVNRMKRAFFDKYNHTADWAAAQKDTLVRVAGDSLASEMLFDVAISYHQGALEKNDSTNYKNAAAAYEKYIRMYPRSKKANECHYNMAEILFSLGDYYRAAEEYIAVSKRYPDGKYRETAAWNAIVASQNLLKKEKAVR